MWWPSFLDCFPCGGFCKMAKPIFYAAICQTGAGGAQFLFDGPVLLPWALMRWRFMLWVPNGQLSYIWFDVCLIQMLMMITSIHMCMCKLWLSYISSISSTHLSLFDRATWFIKNWTIWVIDLKEWQRHTTKRYNNMSSAVQQYEFIYLKLHLKHLITTLTYKIHRSSDESCTSNRWIRRG